jgi:divalent metal cation (Fe/Co/Zn/Cd) transporter
MNWGHWPVERVLFLFVGIAFLSVWVQVTLSHYRQNFHHKSMWVPVVSAPVLSMTSILLVFARTEWLLSLFLYLMWLGVLVGGVGFYYHFHGVGLRVGGYTMRNFLTGPPVTLPLMFSSLSVLGLIAYYWR